MLYSVKQRRWKKKMNNIVSVLPLALKKWKEKTNLREQTKPKYIINEKHAGNTYTYTIHSNTYTYSYVPHSESCLEMKQEKKIYIYI